MLISNRRHQKLEIQIPPPANCSSFYIFALHKSGSVLLNNLIRNACMAKNIPCINLPKEAFTKGLVHDFSAQQTANIFRDKGYCYHGFRYYPNYLTPAKLYDLKKIVLIRDPRDMLVSHYFSITRSHSIPPGKAGIQLQKLRNDANSVSIDEYVVQTAPTFKENFDTYNIILQSNIMIFRYEDVVYHKKKWLCKMLEYLSIDLDEKIINEIIEKYDIIPIKENINRHIRQVTPGNHKVKLKESTISILNHILRDVLIRYDYPIA